LIAKRLIMLKQRVFLIGMMGSGKSIVGAELAARLNVPFVDTDQVIENEQGRSIAKIFEQDGEAHFRSLERACIQNLNTVPQVVACGGGLPCFENNMELLKDFGVVIYLEANSEDLYERIKGDLLRPKLKDYDTFMTLKTEREAFYRQAHHAIDAAQPIDRIIAELLTLLNHQ
jgi:shikimate kinase